jgi:hypothetical protein
LASSRLSRFRLNDHTAVRPSRELQVDSVAAQLRETRAARPHLPGPSPRETSGFAANMYNMLVTFDAHEKSEIWCAPSRGPVALRTQCVIEFALNICSAIARLPQSRRNLVSYCRRSHRAASAMPPVDGQPCAICQSDMKPSQELRSDEHGAHAGGGSAATLASGEAADDRRLASTSSAGAPDGFGLQPRVSRWLHSTVLQCDGKVHVTDRLPSVQTGRRHCGVRHGERTADPRKEPRKGYRDFAVLGTAVLQLTCGRLALQTVKAAQPLPPNYI